MHEPGICVTVTGRTADEMRAAREAAEEVADLVELRLDSMTSPDPAPVLSGRRLPAIATCRPSWEGGGFIGTEDERRRVLESAIGLGAEFVDVEAAASFASEIIGVRAGRGVIVSRHVFGRGDTDIDAEYAALRAMEAEVVKLVVEVDSLDAMEPFFRLADTIPAHHGTHVLIAMGPAGTATRVLAARLGNRWTYAGDGIAPGQIGAARLLHDFRFRRIRHGAALYAVTGRPIGHSLSPAMHNAGFDAAGLNAAYVALEARRADEFVRFARSHRLRGASITAPFKVDMLNLVDQLDPIARRVGAMNTVIVRDEQWIGANTDVDGFLAPLLSRNIQVSGLRASVIGAGGAARAVAVALCDRGASVTICARRPAAARAIAELVGGSPGAFPPARGSWDLLVNTTPATALDTPAGSVAVALDGRIVYDLVYSPPDTPLLIEARRAGCVTIGGLEMLVAQAERQFELWTGQRPPAGLFAASAAAAREPSDTTSRLRTV